MVDWDGELMSSVNGKWLWREESSVGKEEEEERKKEKRKEKKRAGLVRKDKTQTQGPHNMNIFTKMLL